MGFIEERGEVAKGRLKASVEYPLFGLLAYGAGSMFAHGHGLEISTLILSDLVSAREEVGPPLGLGLIR